MSIIKSFNTELTFALETMFFRDPNSFIFDVAPVPLKNF